MKIKQFKIETYIHKSDAFHVARKSLALTCPAYLHTHDYYELFLVEQGSTTHFINGKTALLAKGALVFVRPHDVRAFKASERDGCHIMNIMFRTNTADHLQARYVCEWGDLPKEFVNMKLQGLLDSLSADTLYEVVQYLDGGPFRTSQRAFIGKFYLRAARLGFPRAMERIIFFYAVGMHVQKSILRSMAWAKRRFDFAGGEQAQLFDYLQTLYKGGDIGAFLARWKDQHA